MWIFELFGLCVILSVLYLVVNLMNYFVWRGTKGQGGVFGLSDGWIKKEQEKEGAVKPEGRKK